MDNLPNLLAKLFIARSDLKMYQAANGNWLQSDSSWTRADIEEHLAGRFTYGHYLLSPEYKSKFIVIRISLNDLGSYLWPDDPEAWDSMDNFIGEVREFNPFESWFDRSHESRSWLKFQLKTVAARLCRAIRKELDLPCAVHYNGDGGLDVYAFSRLIKAEAAIEGGKIVIDSLTSWEEQWEPGEANLSLECLNSQFDTVFLPLPLGKNQDRPSEPTFFVDMSGPLDQLAPVGPEWALTTDNPFYRQGE